MTIKEVEQLLEVPRATVRFYEKEGLINPIRKSNGYRDYSEKDVERLKQIIILRKIGLSVEDIEDVFDGAKSIEIVLETNMINLQKQIDELTGALNLCNKMKMDAVQLDTFNTSVYWNYVEEEESKGNRFVDIAKDIIDIERGVFASYFSTVDRDGKPYESFPRILLNVIACTVIVGTLVCLFEGEWSVKNFWSGIQRVISIMVLEMILSIPLYFLGKKYEWIRKNRKKTLFFVALILLIIALVFLIVFGN